MVATASPWLPAALDVISVDLSDSPVTSQNSGEGNMRKMRFFPVNCWALVVGVSLAATPFSWAQGQSRVVVVKATKHAFAPPLSQLVPIPPTSERLSLLADDDDRLPMHEQR